MVKSAMDWEWSSYRVYENGADDALVDLMPSFLGLAANKMRCAAHLRELVDGEVMKQDAGWTRNFVIGTEGFVKKYCLIESAHEGAPPPSHRHIELF